MKAIFTFFLAIISFIFSYSLSGCSSSNHDEPENGPDEVRRTVLVYIVATNNLGSSVNNFDGLDIREMIAGAKKGSIAPDARWLVYHAPLSGEPALYELANGDSASFKVLKSYEYGGSVTIARMSEVLDDVAAFAPAKNYGLVLWSHASGWIVDGVEEPAKPLSFGNDNGSKMNISSLRSAIIGRGIDYIYFDACHMGTVEVAYELRDAVKYIVCGPAETPGEGMPYDENMGFLTDGSKEALVAAARTTYSYYIPIFAEGKWQCTMTVVDVAALDELAEATKAIYEQTPLPHPSENVTNYYGTTKVGNYLDFGEYVNALAESEGIDASAFNEALQKVVIYKEAPELFYSDAYKRKFPIYNASGLSTNVFNRESDFTNKNYNTLRWAQDVVAYHLHD